MLAQRVLSFAVEKDLMGVFFRSYNLLFYNFTELKEDNFIDLTRDKLKNDPEYNKNVILLQIVVKD